MQQRARQLLLSALAAATITQPGWAQHPVVVEDLPAYRTVAPGLYRGGQPSDAGLQKLKDTGVKTIVSLRNNKVLTASERKKAEALGMKFVNIPLDGISKPSNDTIKRFLEVVQDQQAQPVFVHCQFGQDRTGTMIGIYREEAEKWSADKAYKEMIANGFHPKYPWLSDAVYEYEQRNGNRATQSRPLGVRVFDGFQHVFGFLKL